MALNDLNQMMFTSRDLLLTVGQKVTASIRGVKYDIAIWGWKEKEFILVDAPKASGNYLRLASMTGIRVRFVKDGQSILFDTRVILTHAQPPFYMLIEFPQSMEKENMRKFERYKAKFPTVFKKSQGSLAAGTILDLSLGGMLMAHAESLVVGEVVFIDIEFQELGVTVTNLEATVQNVRENILAMKGLNLAGLMFWNNSQKNQQSLQTLIAYLVKEG